MKHYLYLIVFVLLTAVAGLTMSGCVSQTPTPQYAENLTFSMVYTHDDLSNLSSAAISAGIVSDLNTVLTDRNLKVSDVDFNAISAELTAVRDTQRRLQLLQKYATGSQFILLAEVSTEYYSTLSGRYRWNVDVHLSVRDISSRQTLEDKFTLPAVLMYAHENGDDAIASVQVDIERRMGSLVDSFLKGRKASNVAPAAAPVAAPAPVEPPAPVASPEPVSEPVVTPASDVAPQPAVETVSNDTVTPAASDVQE